ncbi:MAG: hypothetical protein ACM3X0_08485 [Bacteroidota bacterium]
MKKRYWAILILLFLVGLDWYIRAPDGRSRQLTSAIASQGGSELKSYPYQFHVYKVVGETAYLSTPRNFEVPAFRMLAVLYPGLNTRDNNDPAFLAAEQMLGRVQSEARLIVLGQPGIKEVRWELDREWLAQHGIEVPAK